MKYTRVYADATGETHYDEVEVAVAPADFAPPTPPVSLSTFHPAMPYAFCRFPAGWVGPWHPTPRRQWFCILSGAMEAQVSDGEVRRFGAGRVVLFEDTAGKGHLSRAVGPTEAWTVVVQLPADRPGAEGTSEAGAPRGSG